MFSQHIKTKVLAPLIAELSSIVSLKTGALLCYIMLFLFQINPLQGQVINNSNLYIGDIGVFYIGKGDFEFGSGTTTTTRTKRDNGILSFSDSSTWKDASTTHFVDGYAQSNTTFVFPVGQLGIYAPVKAIPSSATNIEAAYFREDPKSVGNAIDNTIAVLSSVEYWNIISYDTNTKISLSWKNTSYISDITSATLSNLTIVGWNGLKWIIIPSTIDSESIEGEVSSIHSGSISSTTGLNLSNYSAFSLGSMINSAENTDIKLIAYFNNNKLYIEASQPITALVIYDVLGQKIVAEKINGDFKYNRPFDHAEAVYFALIELNKGASQITLKLMNKY
jgi:hypothetical protein